MNEKLKTLHDTLLARHQALYDQLDTVTDPELAKTILTEMREILHRVDVVQSLLFRQTTAALSKSIEKVKAADAQLQKSLGNTESAAGYVKSISKFLAVVDKAIDLAKTLAPLAV